MSSLPRNKLEPFRKGLDGYRRVATALERAEESGASPDELEKQVLARDAARQKLEKRFDALLRELPGIKPEDVRFDPDTRLESYVAYGDEESWRAHVFVGEAALREDELAKTNGVLAYYHQLARERRDLYRWWQDYERENPGAIRWRDFEKRYAAAASDESLAGLARFLGTIEALEQGIGGTEAEIEGVPERPLVQGLKKRYGKLLRELLTDLRKERVVRVTVERVTEVYAKCRSPILREFLRAEMQTIYRRLEKAWALRRPLEWESARQLFLRYRWPGSEAPAAKRPRIDKEARFAPRPTDLQLALDRFVRGLLPSLRLQSLLPSRAEQLDRFARRYFERYRLLEGLEGGTEVWGWTGPFEFGAPAMDMLSPTTWYGAGGFDLDLEGFRSWGWNWQLPSISRMRSRDAEGARLMQDLRRLASSQRMRGFQGSQLRSLRGPFTAGDLLREVKSARWSSPRFTLLPLRHRNYLKDLSSGADFRARRFRLPDIPRDPGTDALKLRFGRLWSRPGDLPRLARLDSPHFTAAAARSATRDWLPLSLQGLKTLAPWKGFSLRASDWARLAAGVQPAGAPSGLGLAPARMPGFGISRFSLVHLAGSGPAGFPGATYSGYATRWPEPLRNLLSAGSPAVNPLAFLRASGFVPRELGPVGRLFPGAPAYGRWAFRPDSYAAPSAIYPGIRFEPVFLSRTAGAERAGEGGLLGMNAPSAWRFSLVDPVTGRVAPLDLRTTPWGAVGGIPGFLRGPAGELVRKERGSSMGEVRLPAGMRPSRGPGRPVLVRLGDGSVRKAAAGTAPEMRRGRVPVVRPHPARRSAGTGGDVWSGRSGITPSRGAGIGSVASTPVATRTRADSQEQIQILRVLPRVGREGTSRLGWPALKSLGGGAPGPREGFALSGLLTPERVVGLPEGMGFAEEPMPIRLRPTRVSRDGTLVLPGLPRSGLFGFPVKGSPGTGMIGAIGSGRTEFARPLSGTSTAVSAFEAAGAETEGRATFTPAFPEVIGSVEVTLEPGLPASSRTASPSTVPRRVPIVKGASGGSFAAPPELELATPVEARPARSRGASGARWAYRTLQEVYGGPKPSKSRGGKRKDTPPATEERSPRTLDFLLAPGERDQRPVFAADIGRIGSEVTPEVETPEQERGSEMDQTDLAVLADQVWLEIRQEQKIARERDGDIW